MFSDERSGVCGCGDGFGVVVWVEVVMGVGVEGKGLWGVEVL